MPFERKWVWVILTAICFLSTSFTSTNLFRGAIAPLGALVFAFIAVMAFIQDRISSTSRVEHYEPSPEEKKALEIAERKRIEALKARNKMPPST